MKKDSKSNSKKTSKKNNTRKPGRAMMLLAGAALSLSAMLTPALAETHAIIPNMTVNSSNTRKDVAVDEVNHWIFTIAPSNQVQVTLLSNGAWATIPLNGQAAQASSPIFVDSAWHILFYLGTDSHIWAWSFQNGAWVNSVLDSLNIVHALVGVDNVLHWVWSRNGTNLSARGFNGTKWVTTALPSITYDDGGRGAVVDSVNHNVWWSDTNNKLSGVIFTGQFFITHSFDFASYGRPGLGGDGSLYAGMTGNGNVWREYAQAYFFTPGTQQVTTGNEIIAGTIFGAMGVHPTTGKIYYNRYNAGYDVSKLTPSGSGGNTTWTRTTITGTTNHRIAGCSLDTVNNWFFYTNTLDNNLHIIF